MSRSSITILVPVLNEENYVRRAIASLVPADETLDYELIVIDGGSTDCTRQIIEEMGAVNRRIRLASNAGRFQAAAVNRGASIAKPESDIIVRADCHAEYPPGFVNGVVRELRERDVASVVVPMRTVGTSFVQRAIAAAQNSRLGNGGAPHRSTGQSRYVDHGHHAAFDRRAFLSIGGYDESFTHNEDAELDIRLIKSGAKIWFCSDVGITYFPRKSFVALARQYFNHGAGRARTMFKHHNLPKVRQLLPVAASVANLCSLVLGIGLGWPFFLPALAYLGACAAWGGVLARSERDFACLASGPAAGRWTWYPINGQLYSTQSSRPGGVSDVVENPDRRFVAADSTRNSCRALHQIGQPEYRAADNLDKKGSGTDRAIGSPFHRLMTEGKRVPTG